MVCRFHHTHDFMGIDSVSLNHSHCIEYVLDSEFRSAQFTDISVLKLHDSKNIEPCSMR